MSAAPLPDELVRSRSHQLWCLAVAAFCLVMAVTAVVIAAGRANPAPQIGLAVALLMLAAAALWWSRACLVFAYSRRCLVVRNPLRAYILAWHEVRGFELRDSRVGSPQTGQHRTLVKLVRADGSLITCVGACALGRTRATNMQGQLQDALNRRDWQYLQRQSE